MNNQTDIKELLKELIARDPYIAGHLLDFKILGITEATFGRAYIIFYESPKKDIYLILDPWTEKLTIGDKTKGTTYHFHIKRVLRALIELYGIPDRKAIKKFGTNIPLRNTP
jgi:hypothetical protein